MKGSFFFTLAFCYLGAVSQPVLEENQSGLAEPNVSPLNQSEALYEKALVDIHNKLWTQAEEKIQEAIHLNPHFIEAKIQLGYLFLWRGDFQKAESAFYNVLDESSSEKRVLPGLEKIARHYEQSDRKIAIKIYRRLNDAVKNQPDYLFYLGRMLAQDNQWQEAETVLLRCLTLAPQYSDAAMQLGSLYMWEKRWDEAEEIFSRYPSDATARKNLAKVALQRGDVQKAEDLLSKIVKEYPADMEAKYSLAKTYFSDMKFKEAKVEYDSLERTGPIYRELFELKSHTNPSLIIDGTYTAAKENDPSLKAPVVRDFYFNSGITCSVPLTNRLKWNFNGMYGFQKERNIYNNSTTVNFDARIVQGIFISHFLINKDWRWDSATGVVYAENIGQHNYYPFLRTTRFGGGTDFIYNHQPHLLVLDSHTESLVIKDFARTESKILSLVLVDGTYSYRFECTLHPKLEAFIGTTFYDDHLHNYKNSQIAALRFGFPFLEKYFTLSYEFEHHAFDKLSQNYYSFKKQERHIAAIKFSRDFLERGYVSVVYFHRWQNTWNLFQPIGNTVFVAAHQFLRANKVEGLLGYRYKDKCRIELGAHYFRDTLPYRDWNILGNVIFQF